MEEASNTRIVAFQLMQVAHLQAIQIMARFCQGDILAMKRIQYGAHKCVAENVRGFSVAVLPAASLLFRNRLGRSPFPVSGILRLGNRPASSNRRNMTSVLTPHVFRSAFNHSSNSEICRGRAPSFTWTRNVSGTSKCPANAFASLS